MNALERTMNKKRNLDELFGKACVVQTNHRTKRTKRITTSMKRRAVTELPRGRTRRARKHDYKQENEHLHARVETLSKQVQALEMTICAKKEAWRQEREKLLSSGKLLMEHIMVLREDALYMSSHRAPRPLTLVTPAH